jgi:hypothetical protein
VRRLALLFVVTLGACTTSAFAATLNVASWHLWTGSQSLTKSSCTLTGSTVTTDTYADEAHAGDNSIATTMKVKPGAGSQMWTFVHFDLSSCNIPTTGGADTATLSLRITIAPATDRALTVTPVLSTWTGASLANFSAAAGLTYGSVTTTFTTGVTNNVTKSFPVTIDIDALIKSSTANYGWCITDGGSGVPTTTFGSASNPTVGNRPQLVINYES